MRAVPTALSQYVLKVHSRCDLACDHCYVYEHADQSWRGRPRAISPATVRAAAGRIAEHAAAHRLPVVRVVVHGGEPLLLGAARLREIFDELRATVGRVTDVDLRMQTNGVLLSAPLCELFVEHRVSVGVSFDGYAEAHDRHRRFAGGAGSHAQVRRALALLRRPEYRSSYGGLLCTIDIANDPIRVYEALLAEEPPRVEFLLPHATWDEPPPRPEGGTPYADWLLAIHRRWRADGQPVPVRLFDSLRSTASGSPSQTEALGLDPADLAVIETDGAWEQADSLKTAFDGAPVTGLDVFANPVDDVASHPAVAGRQRGLASLCRTCRRCAVVGQCGGGLYAHRYRTGSGFDNPSVYCADLKELIVSTNAGAPAGQPCTAWDLVADLGSGYGGPATVGYLAGVELAITRGLLAGVADALGPAADRAWDTLAGIDEAYPDVTAALLAHPYVRVWAAGLLGAPDHARPLDAAYLTWLAASAAIRAGAAAEVHVAVVDGCVHLPTLGTLRLPADGPPSATVRVGAGSATVLAGNAVVELAADDAAWEPVRRVEVDRLTVALDDLDPFRDCFDAPVSQRLADADAAEWIASLRAAWARIVAEVPGQIPGLLAGLRTVTPMVADPAGRLRSATAKDAFGAVAAGPTGSADALAVLLVHEFQHSKLGALLDVHDLFDRADERRIAVGWRDDPRPVEGALQGTYAHLAVADVWRVRAGRPGPAREHYRRYRTWTSTAIDVLLDSGALTPLGTGFVDAMAERIAGWPA